MSIERRSEVIPASGVIECGRGNFLLFISSTGSVNIRLDRAGKSEGFNGVTGGVLARRSLPWDTLQIFGAAGLTVIYFVGAQETDKDETDIRLQIATIAGVAAVAVEPTAAVTDSAAVAAADAAQSVLFAPNLLRRKLRVFVDENNLGTCYARATGAANNIANLQPGSVYTFDGRYGLDVRNDTGGVATFYIFEES